MPNAEVISEYIRLRSAGWRAREAFRAAKTAVRFAALAREGRVRLAAEPDGTPYDDSYIDTWHVSAKEREKVRAETWRRIESEGVWGIVVYATVEGGREELIDSVWGFVGDDWRDSGYDEDLMDAAIKVAELNRCGDLDPACEGRAA
jgi:hypothetical protein